jgi:hypothetical protein
MKCIICEEEMERGDIDLELYTFYHRQKKKEIKVTRPAAAYECGCCGSRWLWVRGRQGLDLIQKPAVRDVVSEFERRETVINPEDDE